MALIKRITKGSPLTFAEGDANLTYLESVALSASAAASTVTLTFPDMEFTHTSGSRSFFAGVGTAFTASVFGAGVSNDNLTLNPTAPAPYPQYATFKSETQNYRVVGYRFYSNVTGSDFPQYNSQPNGPNISYVALGVASLTAPNFATSGQLISREMFSSVNGAYDGLDGEWQVVPTGSVLSDPPTEIRDTGTLFTTGSVNSTINLGPGQYSQVYYTFLMSIGAGFKSKKYKFRMELDCVEY